MAAYGNNAAGGTSSPSGGGGGGAGAPSVDNNGGAGLTIDVAVSTQEATAWVRLTTTQMLLILVGERTAQQGLVLVES